MRGVIFSINEYYHVFNRGIDKRIIFDGAGDYIRFLLAIKELNAKNPIFSLRDKLHAGNQNNQKLSFGISRSLASGELVEIIAYCLNPNHYHFILKQKQEKGIEKFMHKLGTSYTKYYNIKNERSGSLFQGTYKAVHITSNDQLLYLSAYVNMNDVIHGIPAQSIDYSSRSHYLGNEKSICCDSGVIMDQFNNEPEEYKKFCDGISEYIREKREFNQFLLE